MRDWLTSSTPPIAEPITGREELGDLTRPEQALAQFYRAFNARDLAGLAASWEASSIFYAVGRERGRFERGSVALDLTIRTTRVFRHVDGRWRQIHHHGSIEDPALLGAYRDAVAVRSR